MLERFTQIKPKIIFSVNAVHYNGKVHDHVAKLRAVTQGLEDLEKIVVINFVPSHRPNYSDFKNQYLLPFQPLLEWKMRLPFNPSLPFLFLLLQHRFR